MSEDKPIRDRVLTWMNERYAHTQESPLIKFQIKKKGKKKKKKQQSLYLSCDVRSLPLPHVQNQISNIISMPLIHPTTPKLVCTSGGTFQV